MDAFPGGGAGGGYRRNVNEAGRPTALSLLKSAQGDRYVVLIIHGFS